MFDEFNFRKLILFFYFVLLKMFRNTQRVQKFQKMVENKTRPFGLEHRLCNVK